MSVVDLPYVDLSRYGDTDTLNETNGLHTYEPAGNIEGLVGHRICGWIADSNCQDAVTFFLYEGNRLITIGEACLVRPDLSDAGYKSGAFGFEIDIPDSLMDGQTHELSLRAADCDHILSRYSLAAPAYARSWIERIDSGTVIGSLSLAQPHEANGFDLELIVDGVIVSESVCEKINRDTEFAFSIALQDNLFDDNRHCFSVRLKGQPTVAEPYFESLPSIHTPWSYLSDSAIGSKLSAIPKVASYRYAALQRHLQPSTGEELDTVELLNVKQAHDVLVTGYDNRSLYPVLRLPKPTNPLVSIVIPVHNNLPLTYHCIASLIVASDRPGFEVIVVDDKSSDETTQIEDFVENIHYVRNEDNLGFLLSSQRGADYASGKYIVFLNNDTEVTSGWLDEMLDVFERFENVGAVGSKLIYPNGKLQEAGGIVWGSGKPWNIGNGQNAEHPMYNYTRQVDYLSGASLMVSRQAWDSVGGFSEELAPAYYEDTDLAFKIREAGYRTFYCPFSTVVHFEGMSNGRDTNAGIKRFQSVNAPKFRAKWRHAYKHNGSEGQNLSLHMDRNVDFRALVIDHSTPRPDQDAGSYAATQEISLLQELGCKITFIPNNLAHMGKHTESLQKRGVECIHSPFYPSVADFLQARGKDYDLVYVIRYDIAEQIIELVKQHSAAKIVFNNCDLHFLREIRAALASGESSLEAPIRTRERELQVMRDVDAVLSFNEIEHSVIASHNLKEENVFKCPWVLQDRRSTVPFKQRSGIAFLGGFGHPPNQEAVKYFVSEVMPLLRVSQPDINFHIYGSRITDDILDLACEDVIVEGYVDSLSDVFDTCRVFVAPLISGAGIKGKVLESIAHGIPSVLSPIAAEATGLAHGHSAFIADSPAKWCESIVDLYNDEDTWKRLAKNAHSLVFTEYSRSKGIDRMRDVLTYIELDPALRYQPLFS